MDHRDCFARNGVFGCIALTKKRCNGCAFYKTKMQDYKAQKKAYDRLIRLGRTDVIEHYNVHEPKAPM